MARLLGVFLALPLMAMAAEPATTAVTPVLASSGNLSAQLGQMLLGLLLVIGLIFVLAWLLRRVQQIGPRGNQVIKLLASQALEAGVVVIQIGLQLRRGVAIGIDADQDHLQVVARGLRQLAAKLAQLGEGGRADVRAEGVAKEQQAPLALELIHRHRLAILIGQAQGWQAAALRQQDNAGIEQGRRVAMGRAIEHLVDGQAEDQGNDGDKHKYGFLDAGHRLSNK